MKKLLLATYIILVVTASLASRAETVPPVKLKNAKFLYNSETETLRMVVRYPTSCIRQARAALSLSEYENVVYIDAKASRFGVGCAKTDGNFSAIEIEVKDISAGALKSE